MRLKGINSGGFELNDISLKGVSIGFAVTGSHCTIDEVLLQVKTLAQEGAEIYPVFSTAADQTDTRFGAAEGWKKAMQEITDHPIINTIVGAEHFGPILPVDIMVVAPCTGNTLAKLANAITDGPVLMAVKAHLRNERPVVLGISTNDGLGFNARNLGIVLNAKNIFVVPFGQDNPGNKPNSLKAKMDLLLDTIKMALLGKQIQPVLANL